MAPWTGLLLGLGLLAVGLAILALIWRWGYQAPPHGYHGLPIIAVGLAATGAAITLTLVYRLLAG